MSDERRLDGKIAGLVRSVDEQVPPVLEERIRAAAESVRPAAGLRGRLGPLSGGLLRGRPARAGSRRWPRVLALVPGAAAALVLAVFLLIPALRKPPAPQTSEIRTEFEIADKNIKIVFIQKPDFSLFQEE